MGYFIDYSLFKPRGFYNSSPELKAYFRAVTWLGQVNFSLDDIKMTQAALKICRIFETSAETIKIYKQLRAYYNFTIGSADDTGPLEYLKALEKNNLNPSSDINVVQKALSKSLRVGKISGDANTAITNPGGMSIPGMRFFGKAYIPDSEIFLNIVWPKVQNRLFPSGLDMLKTLGFKQAYGIEENRALEKNSAYIDGLNKSSAIMKNYLKENKSLYSQTLGLISTLKEEPPEKASKVHFTDKWKRKNMTTALGAWASLRHCYILHAKQSATCGGISSDPDLVGYVEPVPLFFKKIGQLACNTRDFFRKIQKNIVSDRSLNKSSKNFSKWLNNLDKFIDLVKQLSKMIEKELAEKPFNKEEIKLFKRYDYVISNLMDFHFNYECDSSFSWMSLVADVHTEFESGQCLEVATGGAMPMYVVISKNGRKQLLKGGVYSYYEFLQPISNRLDDQSWIKMLESGKNPLQPIWTGSYMSMIDPNAIIKKIKQGKTPKTAYYISHPDIDLAIKEQLENRVVNRYKELKVIYANRAKIGMTVKRIDDIKELKLPRGSSNNICHLAVKKLRPKYMANFYYSFIIDYLFFIKKEPFDFSQARAIRRRRNRVIEPFSLGDFIPNIIRESFNYCAKNYQMVNMERYPNDFADFLFELAFNKDPRLRNLAFESLPYVKGKKGQTLAKKLISRTDDFIFLEDHIKKYIYNGCLTFADLSDFEKLFTRANEGLQIKIFGMIKQMCKIYNNPDNYLKLIDLYQYTDKEYEEVVKKIGSLINKSLLTEKMNVIQEAIELSNELKRDNIYQAMFEKILLQPQPLKMFFYNSWMTFKNYSSLETEVLVTCGFFKELDKHLSGSYNELQDIMSVLDHIKTQISIPFLYSLLSFSSDLKIFVKKGINSKLGYCDYAAQMITELVPEAPKSDFTGIKEQNQYIQKLKQYMEKVYFKNRSQKIVLQQAKYRILIAETLYKHNLTTLIPELLKGLTPFQERVNTLYHKICISEVNMLSRQSQNNRLAIYKQFCKHYLVNRRFNENNNFLDPWGSPYVIIQKPETQYTWENRVYSFGPNKVDEKGSGDDLSSWQLNKWVKSRLSGENLPKKLITP